MHQVYCIGEALIDFIETDELTFKGHFGGAPANVALGVSKLGGQSQFIGQVGKDIFGDYLVKTFETYGVDTSAIVRSNKNTPLAFVSLDASKDRSFSFYREHTADLFYQPLNLKTIHFESESILHFCSVSLVPSKIKEAHMHAIAMVKDKNGLISFDVNIRENLWASKKTLRETVLKYLHLVHLLKVSEEELYFLTEKTSIVEALEVLKVYAIQTILVSKGSNGCLVYTNDSTIEHKGFTVKTVDTTGAGDAFISAVLRKVQEKGITLSNYKKADWVTILAYANAAGALTTTQMGATNAIPNNQAITDFLNR